MARPALDADPAAGPLETAGSDAGASVVGADAAHAGASVVGADAAHAGAPPPDGGADHFLMAFDAFAQAVRRARGAPPQEAGERLTLSQYSLLSPLADGGVAGVSDLASQAGVAPSTASRILDALERRGIVRRTRSSRDRRGVKVSLTHDGRDVLGRQDTWMRGRQTAFFDALPPAEQEVVADLLVRLAALIDELSDGPA